MRLLANLELGAILVSCALSGACEVTVEPIKSVSVSSGTAGGGAGGATASPCLQTSDCGDTQICREQSCGWPSSCSELREQRPALQNGAYVIEPSALAARRVYCDMAEDGGGWMLVTRDLLAQEAAERATVAFSEDEHGGLVVTTYANSPGCEDALQVCDSFLLRDDLAWTMIRASYSFAGTTLCYSIFGGNKWGAGCPGANLQPFAADKDVIRDEFQMGLNLMDAFTGRTDLCEPNGSFWRADNGELHRGLVILRRDQADSLAGLHTGVSCADAAPGTASPTWWRYERIYIR